MPPLRRCGRDALSFDILLLTMIVEQGRGCYRIAPRRGVPPHHHGDRIERHFFFFFLMRGGRWLPPLPSRNTCKRRERSTKAAPQLGTLGFEEFGQEERPGHADADADFGESPETEPGGVVGFVGAGAGHSVQIEKYHDGGEAGARVSRS